MLRPNEINEKSFEKVGEGLYSASEVDAFMEEVASSYEQVFKQNGELVRRLSLLANRLEAYRRQEEKAEKDSAKDKGEEFNESLKAKLDQARDVAQKMLDDAKAKATTIVDNANAESDRILVDLKNKIKEQKVSLELMNAQSESFKKKLLETYKEHLILIDSIPTEAEKIVKKSPEQLDESEEIGKREYVVDDDNSDIFSQADEFVEKLDEPVIVDEVEEESSELDDSVEETAVDSASQDPSDISHDFDEPTDIFAGLNESADENEDKAETSAEESDEEKIEEGFSDIGFDFDFSELSFDEDDEEEIDDDDDIDISSGIIDDGPDSSPSDEKENIIADVFASDSDNSDNVSEEFSEELSIDKTEETEENDETVDSSRPSLKDLIRAKGSVDDEIENDLPEDGSIIIEYATDLSSDADKLDDDNENKHFRIEN